jgi:hypothetical protein
MQNIQNETIKRHILGIINVLGGIVEKWEEKHPLTIQMQNKEPLKYGTEYIRSLVFSIDDKQMTAEIMENDSLILTITKNP